MPCFFVGGIKCSRYFRCENDPSLFPNANSSSKVNFQFERKAGWFVFISPFAWPPNWPALVFYCLHVYSYKWLPRITFNLHTSHSLQSRQLLTKLRVFCVFRDKKPIGLYCNEEKYHLAIRNSPAGSVCEGISSSALPQRLLGQTVQ